MVTTRTTIDAPPSAVWATLLDPWTYEVWVRGAKQIRDVDPEWPAVGARFHHIVGVGPVGTADVTRIVRLDPERLLELDAHAWPLGRNAVVLELVEEDGRTVVTMHETPTHGPAAALDNPLQQAALRLRNASSLQKLKKVVEQRHRTAVLTKT